MFSGKSEELIRRVRRAIIARKRVQVFKSHLDARYGGIYSISSHDGRTVEAIPADSAAQIGQQIDPMANVIAIDGGVPIKVGNDVVGGVGLSGSPGVDEQCVMAGINKVKDQLQ